MSAPGTSVQAIDLNADLGEDAGDDAAMMDCVTSANICCGAHAGGPATLRATLALARAKGIAAGAHPGYPDRANFGRIVLPMEHGEIARTVEGQVADAIVAAKGLGTRIRYVKPHGALYNLAARDRSVAEAIARGINAAGPGLVFLGLAGSDMLEAGRTHGLRVAAEAFADRAYRADGTLVPRGEPGAVLTDAAEVAARAVDMVRNRGVMAVDGTRVSLHFDSLCLHGDTPGAVAIARAVRAALLGADVALRPFAGEAG
jgi:UPF0271 protein